MNIDHPALDKLGHPSLSKEGRFQLMHITDLSVVGHNMKMNKKTLPPRGRCPEGADEEYGKRIPIYKKCRYLFHSDLT